MAAQGHVPNGQNIYTDPNYNHLFPGGVEAYGHAQWSVDPNLHPRPHSVDQTGSSVQPSWQTTYNHHPTSGHQYGQFTQAPHQSPYPFAQYAYQQRPTSAIDPVFVQGQPSLRQPYQVQGQNIHQQQPHAQQQQAGTVAPQVLQQNKFPTLSIPKTTTEQFGGPKPTSIWTQQVQKNPSYILPKSKQSGIFHVIDTNLLVKATNSKPLTKFVTISTEALNLPLNRTSLPTYNKRQSLNDLKKLAVGNRKLLAKVSKKSSSHASRVIAANKNRSASVGSPPSLKQESESESETESSDNDSDYTTDDDEPVETSPLPASRPDEPISAVRYDVIKCLWYPKRSPVPTDQIREGLKQFWEVVKTIQDRWRADSKAVTDAEAAHKMSELPLLKSRVQSQRDLLQAVLETALSHGHPDIIHNLGQVRAFLYALYLFLANRLKAQDYDGALTSLIFEILSHCGATLTNEALEATKLNKALNLFQKKANEKNKALIKSIIESAAAGSQKPKAESPAPQAKAEEPKDNKRKAEQPVDAVKKMKVAATNSAPLKTASGAVASKTAISSAAGQKRPGDKPSLTVVKPKVVNKPSGLFASLNAAGKKASPAPSAKPAAKPSTQAKPAAPKRPTPVAAPAPSMGFADVMKSIGMANKEPVVKPKPEKQLPPETPEEKAKRLRKESRRHLRVSFKPDSDLVAIKYFHHDPEEELGHDANMVRDAGDIGGEGRMFKQHMDMDVEDDDDEPEHSYRPWKEPSNIDFTAVAAEERQRNYAPYGGGEQKPVCPEKEANEIRERATLMVFYTDPSDIPSSPREPLEPPAQENPPVMEFGAPTDWVQVRAAKFSPKSATIGNGNQAGNQFAALESIFAQFANQAPGSSQPAAPSAFQTQYPASTPQSSAAAPTPDLSSILSALSQAQQTTQPVLQPTQPAPAVDLSSILATLRTTTISSASTTATAFPTAGVPVYGQPDAAAWWAQAYAQQLQGGQQQQPQPQPNQQPHHNQYTNESGKRGWREDSNTNDRHHGAWKKHKGDDGQKPLGYKVVPCKFWAVGACRKGDKCTFLHDEDERH
ncbi:hypothetical protein GQ43DRAFT_474355 [Delitschia confertaspora ATCC 74209]|uniref:C3H1-type domain-containing protein n=1 Tax=Delitschia confertaspora ATCC 74209 TaxID=1513339 RepID=A0A9P4MW68_9PLEO|nr:hypothetical protein GQ43DRAFT_474355 [Delitschia confertaspora ATCC 74209]